MDYFVKFAIRLRIPRSLQVTARLTTSGILVLIAIPLMLYICCPVKCVVYSMSVVLVSLGIDSTPISLQITGTLLKEREFLRNTFTVISTFLATLVSSILNTHLLTRVVILKAPGKRRDFGFTNLIHSLLMV